MIATATLSIEEAGFTPSGWEKRRAILRRLPLRVRALLVTAWAWRVLPVFE